MKNIILPLSKEELSSLQEVAQHHEFYDFRVRARGVLALNEQWKPKVIASILGVSEKSVYNWAKWWREEGMTGLFDGHKGGRPVTLTAEMVDSAVEIATGEALSLAGIKQRVLELHPQAPDFSLFRLAARLKERGMSYKRCRLSLKKSDQNRPSPKRKLSLKS